MSKGIEYNILDLIEGAGDLKHLITQYFPKLKEPYESWLEILGGATPYGDFKELDDPRTGQKVPVKEPYDLPLQYAISSKELIDAINAFRTELDQKIGNARTSDVKDALACISCALDPIKKYARITKAFAKDQLEVYKAAKNLLKSQKEAEIEEIKQKTLEPFNTDISRAKQFEKALFSVDV